MIIARVYSLHEAEGFAERVCGLPGEPFPGDTVKLADGVVVRVLRRQYHEKTGDGDDQIDVELGVRLA